MTTEINQDDDFVAFVVDGVEFSLDLYEARDSMTRIDIKHKDDQWACEECEAVFHRTTDNDKALCPECGGKKTFRDEKWLDSVAEYVLTKSKLTRCSRYTAGRIYNVIVEKMEAIKKKREQTPASPITLESIPAGGEAAENEHSSNT